MIGGTLGLLVCLWVAALGHATYMWLLWGFLIGFGVDFLFRLIIATNTVEEATNLGIVLVDSIDISDTVIGVASGAGDVIGEVASGIGDVASGAGEIIGGIGEAIGSIDL